jgi:hypothetical protein
MGFFDKLFKNQSQENPGNTCPACGSMASYVGGRVRCSNPSCANYAAIPNSGTQGSKRRGGSFLPQRPIEIRYTNFRNESKSFNADAATLVRKNKYITAQVAPSGERITLARTRIQNLSEVEGSFPQPVAPGQDWPSAKERQVLNYHKKYGSTSPLYEKIRAKYPNW